MKKEQMPRDRCRFGIALIHKKSDRSCWANYNKVNLISGLYKLLADIIFCRLLSAHRERTREEQAGFRIGRSCFDQQAYLSSAHGLYLSWFECTIRLIRPCDVSHGRDVSERFISLFKSLYANSQNAGHGDIDQSSDSQAVLPIFWPLDHRGIRRKYEVHE